MTTRVRSTTRPRGGAALYSALCGTLCAALAAACGPGADRRAGAVWTVDTTAVLGSRTPVSSHILDALKPFVGALGEDDLESVLGAADKSLLRSPEVALDGTSLSTLLEGIHDELM